MPLDISKIQSEVAAAGINGWLFYGFHDVDPIAIDVLELPKDRLYSRRWFYLIPASGQPVKLVNRVEREALAVLPGETMEYSAWRELHEQLRTLLQSAPTVAMQYSPDSSIPYVSRVDGGILDLVRKCGGNVVTSADLVQKFQAVWSPAQLEMHRRSAQKLHRIVEQTFAWVARRFWEAKVDEFSIQQEMVRLFAENELVFDHPPIVAFNENASNPHFSPSRENSKVGKHGDILLIDLWGKESERGAVFADITWMGVLDAAPGARQKQIFDLDARARDAGVEFLERRWARKEKTHGWEVDDVVRNVIADAGLAEYFIHRTGHSIGEKDHGNGVNMDNLETRDEREIIPGVCFSIEPGIYLPEFGVRTEINVYMDRDHGPTVTTQPVQRELVCIL
ncbi:MAG TPA: M24 family metallopeptidase [Acidobacteriota bacterium]|jgi:Xaa-Pro aminopeptidase